MGAQQSAPHSEAQHTAEQSVAALIKRSRQAQAVIENYSQQQVDTLITAMVWAVAQDLRAEQIARFTLAETRLGNYDGKYLKIHRKTRAALLDIIHDKSVGVIEELPERNIVKIAKPVGVIGAFAPCTNPEATPVIKAICAIKGRNSIIIAPHPRAKGTNKLICQYLREAIKACGAPQDLVIALDEGSPALSNELMRQCDRVLATGGATKVKAAYSSGTPALGVGVGNAVTCVDDSADLDEAAEKIRISKTLDLAASCSADNAVLAFDSIAQPLLEKLEAQGGHRLNPEEKQRLEKTLWRKGTLRPRIFAQPAEVLAEMAGIELPKEKSFFIVEESGCGPEHPFSGEKMSVTLAFYRVSDMDDAIATCNAIQSYQGMGHSCGIYSKNDANIMAWAMGTKTARVMVNQPQAASNSGNLWNGMPQTFSLACGSWGGNSTTNNISWQELVNITWVSRPLKESKVLPPDEQLFASALAGKTVHD